MKNHTDVLVFHTAFCAEASQRSLDATTEIAYANFCCAIPTQRFGMEISMRFDNHIIAEKREFFNPPFADFGFVFSPFSSS